MTSLTSSMWKTTLALGLIVTAVAAGPARAGDIQGDAYDCAELWVMKNQIYKDRGYCFKTAKAIAHFGNADCRYDVEADVPLSDVDRTVITDIKRSMRRQHC